MKSKKVTLLNDMPIPKILILGLTLLFINNTYAQKSSGTIRGEIINPVEQVERKVVPVINKNNAVNKELQTSSIGSSKNRVRFLLRPQNEAIIATQMSGVISNIKFNVGQRFNKGDILVSLRCGMQNAQLEAQRARVREALLTYRSNKDLLAGNAVSQYEADIAQAQLSQQNATLKESKLVASLCNVKAPFSGGVVSVDVNEFETVSTGTPLLSIINDNSLVMSLNIPSTFINKVNKGKFFTIVVDETSKNYKAKVTGVSPAIDPVSKTIELRAVLVQKSPELKPGMSGTAKLNFTDN